MEIWVDRETGVNYVFHASGYAGGMTPLLDRDGKTSNFSGTEQVKYLVDS